MKLTDRICHSIMKSRMSRISFGHYGFIFLLFYIAATIGMIIYLRHNGSDRVLEELYQETSTRTHVHFEPKHQPLESTNNCYGVGREPRFQSINNKVHILSAFYDTRDPQFTVIRLFALALPKAVRQPLYCLIRGVNKPMQTAKVQFHQLHGEKNATYMSYMLTCTLLETLHDNPCKVYISAQRGLADNYVTIPLLFLDARQPLHSYGICLSPHTGVITQNALVEFIEFNRMLGVDHFYFYRYHGDIQHPYQNVNVDQVLQYYQSLGIVKVYDWTIPILANQTWQYGRSLASQHCLYSNMWMYTYLAFLTVDQYIVPHNVSTWAEITELYSRSDHSALCVRNAHFPPELGESLMTVYSTKRTVMSKLGNLNCISRPEKLREIGENFFPHPLDNMQHHVVEAKVALMHIYGPCKEHGEQCQANLDDNAAVKYAIELKRNFKSALNHIKDIAISSQR